MKVFLAVLMVALLIAAVIVCALWAAEDIKKTLAHGDPFDFDDHADEAIALLGDDFGLWEKELTIR